MDIRELRWQLANEILGMWRYRWVALAAVWVLALIGWTMTLLIPNEYKATARVYVDTETVLRPLLRGLAVQPDTLTQVDLMTRALKSRPQLETVATKAGLATSAITPKDFEVLVNRLERRITINKARRESIYSISYRDTDPEKASDVVQTLLDAFMENTLIEDRSEAVQAQRFLREQISVNEARLEEAEQRLAKFKRENVGLMPGQGGGYYQRLQTAEANVRSLESRIQTAKQRSRTLQAQLRGETPSLPPLGSNLPPPTQPIDATIAQFEERLSDLLLRYTEKHPDVLSTRETLRDLYAQRDQVNSGGGNEVTGSPGVSSGMNPIYQELRIALSDSEVEVAALQAELRDEKQNLSYLRSMVDTIPKVEAELNKLNRDYDVVQTQYQQLLSRLESARLAEEVQADSESVTFDVIDPPRIPIFPEAPDRELLSMAVLLVALAFGVGITFLLSKNKPVYYTVPSLRDAVSIPIYGLVGAIPKPGQTRRNMLFAICGVALLAPLVVASSNRASEFVASLKTMTQGLFT